MRVLVSTFADGDGDKVVLAMRELGYERVVLICEDDCEGPSLDRLRRLEGLSGNEVHLREIRANGFLDMVDGISEELVRLREGSGPNETNELILNISGGSKIMGDAALLAAFRLGVETYHCDRTTTRLPVLTGLTAKDRFTELQVRMLEVLSAGEIPLTEVMRRMQPNSKTSTERTIRELKKMGLLRSKVEDRAVLLHLSPEGAEVARAAKFARGK